MIKQKQMMCNRIFKALLLVLFMSSLSAQEITRIEYIPRMMENNMPSTRVALTDRIIEDHGRYYLNFSNVRREADQRDWGVDVDLSMMPDPFLNGFDEPDNSLLLEYVPDEGFVDYTLYNYGHTSRHHEYSIDGDHIALAIRTISLGLDNVLVHPDTTEATRDTIYGEDLIVYDKLNDTILWHYVDEHPNSLDADCVGLFGDYLYYATTTGAEMPFMGDSLTHFYPDSFGLVQFTTMLHKINWRTNEKLWSHHIGGYDLKDKVRQIKLIDDGTLIIEMEINRPFTWDGEQLDPDHFYGSGGFNGFDGWYNLVLLKITQEGEYVDHAHIKALYNGVFTDVKIEDEGDIYCSGFITNQAFIELEQDTIAFDTLSDKSGVLMTFDKDLNLQWYKTYEGNDIENGVGIRGVKGANKLINGGVTSFLQFSNNVVIDSTLYNTTLPEVSNVESYILHHDENGYEKSIPRLFTGRSFIYDLIEVEINHYLILAEIRYTDMVELPLFLGVDPYYEGPSTNNLLIEVKGDLFESVSAVNNLLDDSELHLYPNPCYRGQQIILNIFESLVGQEGTMTISNSRGDILYRSSSLNLNNNLRIDTDLYEPGIYTCTIATKEDTVSRMFIIN